MCDSDSWLHQISNNCNNLKSITFNFKNKITINGVTQLFNLLYLEKLDVTYNYCCYNSIIRKQIDDILYYFEINKIRNKNKIAFLTFCTGSKACKASIYTDFFDSRMFEKYLLKYIYLFIKS